MPVAAFAPAKVNLYLHILGRRPDGYHLIDSLVAFADIGDALEASLAPELSLEIVGPEATALAAAGENNLVLRAARRLAEAAGIQSGAALRLEKRLPVASGLGGGSSDAAAAFKLLAGLWRTAFDDDALAALGLSLGADLPVCLYGRPAWVEGIGERVEPAQRLPLAGILLANPRIELSTAAVFAGRRGPFSGGARFSPMSKTAQDLARRLAASRNDLTEPAIALCPAIATALDGLAALPRALLARMTGSGATCFALFPDVAAAHRAKERFAAAHPGWWCAAGSLICGTQPA